MRLAILVTNTDDSAFARARDSDAVKFAKLVALARPDWHCEAFEVTQGVFPDDPGAFDGLVVGGSPASVHDPDPWVGRLLELIRKAESRRLPMFGACFGHQAIALALGGEVGANPGGWSLGRIETDVIDPAPWMSALPRSLALYAAHKEQVRLSPDGARILCRTPGCVNAGFAIGRHVYTTQYHPEILPDFMADLLVEMQGHAPDEVLERARSTLALPPDTAVAAESIAQFFEQAQQVNRGRPAGPSR